jgi:hypothetical protein
MPQYEFNNEENQLIGSLAGKMRFVGLFAVILGVINLIMAILVIVAIYRDQVPKEWKDQITKSMQQLPDDVKKQTEKYSLDKLPANNHLWGIAINAAVVGLFYLLMGTWTRAAGGSFQKIVDTRGNDITNLMNGMGELHKMYTLIYMLLVITLLFGVIAIVWTLYRSFAG